ncbi:hypothetical protein [Advenella incenata]|nr:hypothetical protein [Advenella incenata]
MLDSTDAVEYLETFVPFIQADILEQRNAYGPIRWFWYLRRAPICLFKGRYGTTLGYDLIPAEMLSSQFTAIDVSEVAGALQNGTAS